jgi:polysaccharide biosynthesis transport protein
MDQTTRADTRTAFELRDIVQIARRRAPMLAGGAGLGALLALFLVTMTPAQYAATATLMVDSRQEKVLATDAVVSRFEPSSTAIASEAAIITAPSVLKRVVEGLDLRNDPDFRVVRRGPGMFGSIKDALLSRFASPQREAGSEGLSEETIEIVDRLRKSLEVSASQYTNLIQVTAKSGSARKAARIANAVADAYLMQQIEGRYNATKRATDWLRERLEEQRVKLRHSEGRFEEFKAQMELVDKEGTTLEEKQLVRLNEELVLTRARTAEARAKYQGVKQQADGRNFDDQQLAEFVRSDMITQLRTQLAQVTRDEGSLSARFGYAHPAVLKARAEKKSLDSQIDQEVRRIVAFLKSEYDVASSREASLQASLQAATERASSQRSEYVQLRELQREAESDKVLYEAMLQRMKQATAQETWKATDFRVVAEAVPPLAPSQPKTKVLAAVGMMLGLGLGIGLTMASELFDTTFKRGRDVEAKLGVPHLADIPLLPPDQLGSAGSLRMPTRLAMHLGADQAGSPFSDAILGLHTALQATAAEQPLKTVLFTSTTPGEGKSVLAAGYARLAARLGHRVLLICTDMRTPTVNWFAPDKAPACDLIDYLVGKVGIEALIARNEHARIDMVPATRSTPNAAALLASPRMQELLDWARANYDLVAIDTVAAVTNLDGRMLARHADATVLVIEWLHTKAETAREAVDLLLRNDARIAGAVLNKVDPAKAGLYGLHGLPSG